QTPEREAGRGAGPAAAPVGWTGGLSDRATTVPTTATGTNSRNQRDSCAPPRTPGSAAASAPNDPAAAATALYNPKPWTCVGVGRTAASIGCSRDVNGPDSITSVDSTPTSDATVRSHTGPDEANVTPTRPRRTYGPAYDRRRRSRSAYRARSTDINAAPATTAPSTSPTCQPGTCRSSRLVPRSTAPKP